MTGVPSSADITKFHDGLRANPSASPRFESGIWAAIVANHWHNSMLWEEEDLARRRYVSNDEIAANKRAIDSHNQKRNDAIERIDEALLFAFKDVIRRPRARLNSETAGAMIDRLSILSLKMNAMRKQTERSDVEPAHIEKCNAKLGTLTGQRQDLAGCLDQLLADFSRGEAYFKIYRQFKMYNDPELNPAVYNEVNRSRGS